MKNAKELCNKIIYILIIALMTCAIGVSIYSINANKVAGNQMPIPLGIGASVVLSGSMEPYLSVGDLIIVKEKKSYDIGDVIVYQKDSILIVHRLITIDGNTYITKGDNNNVADEPIGKVQIKASVIYKVPYVGFIVQAIKTPVGILFMILSILIIIESSTRRGRKNKEEQLNEILDEINKLRKQNEEDKGE